MSVISNEARIKKLEKKVAELEKEIVELRLMPREIHNHFHNHTMIETVPYNPYQPDIIWSNVNQT